MGTPPLAGRRAKAALVLAAVVVPAKATRSLSQLGTPAGQLPLISMLDRTTIQDACKDTTFELTYVGRATR